MNGGALTFLEFFAGGGMARAGLGARWRCLFANDADAKKRAAYAANFGDGHLDGRDVNALRVADLPRARADLAWASSPCQDVSLAGARGGLSGRRSGAFFGFWSLIEDLGTHNRRPRAIVIENVRGLATSNGGADFARIVRLLTDAGYNAAAMALDAADFAPQSRPRLFILGLPHDAPARLFAAAPNPATAPRALVEAAARLGAGAALRWIAAAPARRRSADLIDIIDRDAPVDSLDATRRRLAMMSPRQRRALDALCASGAETAGAAFVRIREAGGARVQRFEARFDGLAGCLRTPAGGSSRQILVLVRKGRVSTRLMTAREAARAMGLDESYVLPARQNDALKLVGDGVCPGVVGWLARAVLEPALARPAKIAA